MPAALVATTANNNGAGALTLVLTISASQAGEAIIIPIAPRGTPTISSISDNINLTTGWTTAVITNPDPVGANAVMGAYNLLGSAGITTITITFLASAIACAFAHRATGIQSYIGGIQSGNGAVPTTSFNSGNVVCGGQAFGTGWSSTGTTGLSFTPGGSWINSAGTGITSGSNTNATDGDQVYCETQIFPGASTNTANGTSTSATQITGAMFFLGTAGGGGGAGARNRLLMGAG